MSSNPVRPTALDLGSTTLIAFPHDHDAADEIRWEAWRRLSSHGLPPQALIAGARDTLTDALRDLAILAAEHAQSPLEWFENDFTTRSMRADIFPGRAYEQRRDLAPASEACITTWTGRVHGRVDERLLRDALYHPRLGLLTNVFVDLSSTGVCLVGAEFPYHGAEVVSFGRGPDTRRAEAIALLEAMERYCLHDVEGVIHRTSFDRNGGYVDPLRFLNFNAPAAARREHVAYTPTDEILWIRALDYRSFLPRHVPLQTVELGHVAEPRYLHESSSGTALGGSLSEARLFALCEMIERDAFLVFWASRVPLHRIGTDLLPEGLRRRVAEAEATGVRVSLFDLTFDIPLPTVLCLIEDDAGPVHTYISTGSHLVPELAISAALDEAVVGRDIFAVNPTIREDPFPENAAVVDMFDHVRRASTRRFSATYDFLRTDDCVDFPNWAARYPTYEHADTAAERLSLLVALLPHDYDVLFVDLTKDVSARLGLYVAKALIPDLLPMTFGHNQRRIRHDRVLRAITGSSFAPLLPVVTRHLPLQADEPHPYP